MPIHEVYESMIAKAGASFGFLGFDCDPDMITTALGIEPDDLVRKGELRERRNGKVLPNPINSWSISSSSSSKDINEHLRELLARLASKQECLAKSFGTPSFSILWEAAFLHQATGPYFEADVLQGIASFAADLYQEIREVPESEC
jgi:hypothetical protein